MKRIARLFVIIALGLCLLPQHVLAAQLLVPGGELIGLELHNGTVTVAAFEDTLCANAREAGLCIGDEIVKIDGIPVDSAQDVRAALDSAEGAVDLIVQRNGKQHKLTVTPARTPQGPKLGVYLRQGICGIGTVTYYDPATHEFGALGHGVSEASGQLLDMTRGSACRGTVLSVVPGKAGTPGQLKGCADADLPAGTLTKNTARGIFGISRSGFRGQPLPVAEYADVRTGDAVIRSTVSGDTPREYSVEIVKIYAQNRPDGRNFLIRITDGELLAATGGIVQGMSGSPIIQDGKLIGAVTHVLVNDPTTGYGIFIENMLDAAA